jgi:hypothetical protein
MPSRNSKNAGGSARGARSTKAKAKATATRSASAGRGSAEGRASEREPRPAKPLVVAGSVEPVGDRVTPLTPLAPVGPFRLIERAERLAGAAAAGEPTPRAARAGRVAAEPPPRAAADTRGKYVYCIIPTNEPLRFGRLGIGGEAPDVHTINYKNIAAVVSDTPIEVHEPTRENVLAHERVNETVMRNHTVIPMSFGTVFKTRDDIIELLRSAYEAFNEVLVKMQDKLEFGLKVLWDSDVMLREIEAEDEDVRKLKNEISSQKGSTYFARMQYGRLVDAALQARSERYVADIFEQLREVSVASRANKPIGDKMIMNAAFLVSRDKEAAFDARVKAIGAKYDKVTFKYTGPWPPYNFVNIRLKLERAKDAK